MMSNDAYGRAALKAARRLLEVCKVETEVSEIAGSATLAGALQAVLIADTLRNGSKADLAATHVMVAGLASAIGWVLAKGPADGWDAGLDYLKVQARAATAAHAEYDARQKGRAH